MKHLYFELPAARLHQQFALFNQGDLKGNGAELQALKEHLEACSVSGFDKIFEICLIAKMHGIQVWPVDMSIGGLSELSSIERAVTQRDRVMLKNIRYYSSLLEEDQKYIGLFGAIHYQVGLSLGIPNIRITLPKKTPPSERLPDESMSERLENESERKLYALQKKLYHELSPEEKRQFKNSHDVVLTILPSNREFTLELHKK